MCVSGFRILKKIENWFTNKGAIAISVRCVFNKNHSRRKSLLSDANYSIKHNINILLYSILQIDVCLRIQNLKKIENWFKNKGAIAISVRCVFNKNHSRRKSLLFRCKLLNKTQK